MINFYPRSVLRERGPGTFEDTDVSRYVKVWMRLHEIIFGCMGPGWGAVGEEIFFFFFPFVFEGAGGERDGQMASRGKNVFLLLVFNLFFFFFSLFFAGGL